MKYLISAGHGGADPGAVANGHTEASIALDMRDRVAEQLLALRHTVYMDGARGQNWTLKQALPLIKGTDLAVELHCNAHANLQARGVEVIAMPAKKLVAQRIARALAEATGQPLRGAGGWIDQSQSARGRLAFVNAGGLIVEMLFITHLPDLQRLNADRDAAAKALAVAVCANQVGG
jgi:N-acetylmuramoyl-L-alanine amidase